MTAGTEGPEGSGRESWLTAEMLKALAHPIRQRLVRLLRRREYLRAADAAAELGEPANKVSFHLRVLADAGFLVEAPERARDGRDRVWRAVPGAWNLGGPEHPVPDEALGAVVLRSVADEHQDLVRRVVAWAPDYTSGRDADTHGTFTRASARLTPAEFEALMERIQDLIAEAERAHDRADPASTFYEIDIVAADDTLR
ncbi:winged helix-turn-helix domain-containing protein [Microbacterium excoecariae]|uniref:winged helix-turn-helix domain-containing protein n=1 Tax=Microbacterium excoecariae TaxID=2715210 RepID=UPI0014077EE1|nr:helix-turn-helix domain-containing protein [Microbacterium excoecariae]NHI16164.1 helix-turn-helix transcriptional regulator [Microbacterium excoecariae]